MSTKYSLHAVRQKFKETHPGVTDTVDFTITDDKDAKTYHFEHPFLQTNATTRRIAEASKKGDDLSLAQALLGDQWDDFEAEGGQAGDVLMLFTQVREELSDTMPDGSPTQR